MSNIDDDLRLSLADLGFTGAIPEAMYNHLGSLGHVGAISDRLSKEGGFQSYLGLVLGAQAPTTGNILVFANPNDAAGTWDFGDGNTSTTVNPTHEYVVHGTYEAVFTSTSGNDDTSQTVVVAPQVLPSGGFTFLAGNPDSNVLVFLATGGSSYLWDIDSTTYSIANPTHTFSVGGNYNASCVVSDSYGNTDFVTQDIAVLMPNINPVVDFLYGTDKLVVTFTANATDPDGIDTNMTYLWDFGDGIGTSTEENPVYAYLTEEEVTVTLTVTDERSGVTIDSKTFNVYVEYQLGAELMTNPDFTTTDVSDFSLSNVTMSIAGGINTVTATAGGQDFFSFSKVMTIGKRYLCEYRLRNLVSTDGVIKNWGGTEETIREDLLGTMTTYNIIMTADEASLIAYTYATAGGNIGDSIEIEKLSFKEML